MYFAGVDVGSTQTKAVIIDENKNIIGRTLIMTGANVSRAAENAFKKVLQEAFIEEKDVKYVVGTCYGRYKVTFGDAQITEISCHAKGAHFLLPNTRTVIDMGGQDTKVIKVGANGEVLDFCMNDKCAAGTGRFLASAAAVMSLSLDEIGPIALKGNEPVKITTVCTVFVESDIMSYLAQNKKMENILLGVHKAIAARTASLARRVGVEKEITFTGGVAKNICMVKMLEEKLEMSINTHEMSHYIGALGASLFALERAQ